MNPVLLRAVLASLPLLGFALQAKIGFFYGAFGFFVLLVATFIFLAARVVIPKAFRRLSFFLLVLALGVTVREMIGVDPSRGTALPLVSLCVLALPDLFRGRPKWNRLAKKTLGVGLSFWALLTAHGILLDLLGNGMGLRLFQIPAGSYLVAGLAFSILPVSRSKK